MESSIILQILLLLSLLTLFALILGQYMARVFCAETTPLSKVLRPIELLLYKLFGVNEYEEMTWKVYAKNLIAFNIIGIGVLFLIQELQSFLPLNPQSLSNIKADLALNTAISFPTNTDWQNYSGEKTMSYFTQMFGLTVQNFLSAAIGIATAIAFIRGFVRKTTNELGNFWVDITRAIVYILLPLAIVFALILISQGVVQNFKPYVQAKTIEGEMALIAQGPAASQIAIKHLGTNGGGFFNANSAHPYENPNVLTNYLEILTLLLIPAAFPFTLGRMMNNRKQGWILYTTMMLLFLVGLFGALWFEFQGNPLLNKLGIENGSNMEGKELRYGIENSILFAQATTATACGAVNALHDSLMPIPGLTLMFNMMIGEIIFGGVGTGMIGILAYAILTMFLIGLMIGRTPEIFGKKLGSREIILVALLLLLPSMIQLLFGSIAISTSAGLSSLGNSGPHGLSEIIYAFASAAGNNGSAFGGLNGNTFFYNLTLSAVMLMGRFAIIIPALGIAGSLAAKNKIPEEVQFPTTNFLFLSILIGIIVIVGALTFFPVLVIGPFLEHLLIEGGQSF